MGEGMTAIADIGDRVRLVHPVDRYPHFVAAEGMEGTVTQNDDEAFSVRLDITIEGAESWDNEVCWYPSNGDDPSEDIERIGA
jgi:hypothetical protein